MVVSRKGALAAVKIFTTYVIWSAGWIINLKTEIRGKVPTSEVLIASKHQSFLDIIMIYSVIPNGWFIMKRELLYIPIIGQYAYRLGCIAVSRGKRGRAIFQMIKDLESRKEIGGQLVVFPQGTRVKPGVKKPYKIGVSVIYDNLGQHCVPVATNAGFFWPKRGIYRASGTAVIEFLESIPPKIHKDEFLSRLESVIEGSSENLLSEAKSNM
jgi:1-acyl-sn-glycerol-3-phosphate acyltransferase